MFSKAFFYDPQSTLASFQSPLSARFQLISHLLAIVRWRGHNNMTVVCTTVNNVQSPMTFFAMLSNRGLNNYPLLRIQNNGVKVNDAKVVNADNVACNGVVHKIDA